MASKFPPAKDAELLDMANTASAIITTDFAALGLSSLQATTLASKVASYQSSYALAKAPATRTSTTVADFRDAKAALVANLRDLNRYVQANKALTDGQKLAIQFPVYATRTPINAPAEPPVVTIASQGPWRMKLHLRQADATRRGFPIGVKTAFVFTYQGPLPLPTDVSQWSFQGSSSKPDMEVVLNSSIPAGSLIYVTACWLNPRQQASSLAAPISTNVVGGVGGSTGGTSADDAMKMAA